jgi:hypothetical protein
MENEFFCESPNNGESNNIQNIFDWLNDLDFSLDFFEGMFDDGILKKITVRASRGVSRTSAQVAGEVPSELGGQVFGGIGSFFSVIEIYKGWDDIVSALEDENMTDTGRIMQAFSGT